MISGFTGPRISYSDYLYHKDAINQVSLISHDNVDTYKIIRTMNKYNKNKFK